MQTNIFGSYKSSKVRKIHIITWYYLPLGSGESQRSVGQEASAAVADGEWQGALQQSRLLPVRPHLCQGHVCEDNGPPVGAKREEWHRYVQGGG